VFNEGEVCNTCDLAVDFIVKRAMVIILGIKYHIQSYSHYEWLLLQVKFERCAYTTDSI
jgi:hypothetical protein